MKNSDQPAYPILDPNSSYYREGLTKREYFAGLAMQGLMSATNMNGEWTHDIKSAVEISVKAADALLKQLEQ